MLTKNRYSIKELLYWTRKETFYIGLYVTLIAILYSVVGLEFLNLPWTPIALIGTAVAFIIGFQNSAAYGRIWEARKIWGGIVNSSRSWGMKVRDMVSDEKEVHILVYRHIAWMTALRYAMRQARTWEVSHKEKTNKEWMDIIKPPEKQLALEEALRPYLDAGELDYVLSKNNKQTALLYIQSKHLKRLQEDGKLWEFSFLELEKLLEEFFTLQGKSERIKNFPYPRQYATLSHFFVRLFVLMLPFGIIPEFVTIGESLMETHPLIAPYFKWLCIPFCTAVSWVFYTMERIGRVGENPFEGSANDVPISSISRGIEIDLRQMMNEDHAGIPEQFPQYHHVQL
ncbi:bestrophin family protein [Sediminicola luteus]|uniref:Multidrug transporter n=1 Tax=Sediminicola luteus TaxID=319238 RepID=A0A2A4G2L8_9FLAO|nr:bestrophin family ion channel [Sediminicola luteus]PCE62927.1 hypothetical protein B7P33_16765 [Sediminicola luteus]